MPNPIAGPVKKEATDPFRLSDLKPRLGLEGCINSAYTLGIGPMFELQVNPSISLSLGILASKGKELKFMSSKEFQDKIHQAFATVYKNELGPDPGHIAEIEIYTSYIELPLRIRYYIPAGKRLSLVPFAGTHFDISSTEQVTYEHYRSGHEEHLTFTRKPKTAFFHNYIFGFGIQWKGEKTAWQLAPYYNYNFRQSTLYENANLFGASLSLWLPLYNQ